MKFKDTFPQRHTVVTSHGSGYGVWDRHTRKVVARYRTFKQAQKEAKRRNREEA